MTNKEKVEAFLKDLEEISRKYGVVINGCGCCDSPAADIISEDKCGPDYGYHCTFYEDRNGTDWIRWKKK